jgi:hypothetical protein
MSSDKKRRPTTIIIIALVGILIIICLLIGLPGSGKKSDEADWKVYTSEPRSATSTPIVRTSSISIQGIGDDVKHFTVQHAGRAELDIHHNGKSNFAVKVLANDGDYIDLLVNDIGKYSGKRSITLSPGDYVFEVIADGNWSINGTIP